MSFSSDWLALREPLDLAARNPEVRTAFAIRSAQGPHRILDLGCGTGASLRAIAPHLPLPVHWVLADLDPHLLQEAARRHPEAETQRLDLNDVAALPLVEGGHITASALFDLCSEEMVQALIARLSTEGNALYAALNYDGRVHWSEAHPLDGAVLGAFNLHQQRDKGFGPALGPRAGAELARLAEAAGLHVVRGESLWRMDASHADLQRAFLQGMQDAVTETGEVPDLQDWFAFRQSAVGGQGTCIVGHLDILAMPQP
ncbi:class I SAM-dependent methyltransferase [Falsirhodobacter algicola]|uniref:Methyltransferase domain-containing protein n=1 Tax=Falsirhodobacter algicola TaxID=2692330 RepID=A0A8J8MRY1_9RHOB|nr:class I SAM-dependent methyltransferase [Falsirhodobacter algicola]QUS35271.1 methyltransferase domain-containing protein [Falsirhodobacter algicola]